MTAAARFAICEFTTLGATFDEDLAAYASAGAAGIGICEPKLPDGRDAESIAALRASGLRATACVPAVPSILPLPLMPGPADPGERVEAICASIRRLAAFEPACVFFLTGPRGSLDEAEARRVVVEGIRAIADASAAAGVPVGLEPIHASGAADFSFVHTLSAAAELLDAASASSLGLVVDTWNLCESPGLEEEIRRHGDRIVAVHVADRREPTRSQFDRVLPGDGVIDLPPIVAAVEGTGYAGTYDLEIFSDNGVFSDRFPDSLWDLDAWELAERGTASFARVWEAC